MNSTSPTSSELSSSVSHLISTIPHQLDPISFLPPLPSHLPSIIDHTLLAPTATPSDITKICQEAKQLKAATVCVNSSMIPTAAKQLQGSDVLPISVVGFPFGAMSSSSKGDEAKRAVEEGAKEIDMVLNLGFLMSSDYSSIYTDVSTVVKSSSPYPVKVILESSLLTRDQLIAASHISCLAGAAFLKTSTGYALPPTGGWGSGQNKKTSGAQVEDVRLMYEVARLYEKESGRKVEVKASGGIRGLQVVREMWKNGATRVGASGTEKILEEVEAESKGEKVEQQAGGGY